ncbi:hypothetical protein D3Z36_17140 [Lachnospiraceae bacterium]|nr:hypothetical protein [Lachnospiraceae bacterium]
MKRKKEIIIGLLLIIGAVFIMVDKRGFFWDIGLFKIIVTVILAGILIDNLMERSFGGILFSLAFLGILYDKPLGIEHLTPWPILGAALLLTIGLNMIFKKKHVEIEMKYDDTQDRYWQKKETVIDEDCGDTVECSAHFSSTVKYIKSPHFKRGYLKSSFGNLCVYFDNTHIEAGEEAVIFTDVHMGNLELYIPGEWKIVLDVNTSFGNVEESRKRKAETENAILRITGDISFGGMEIYYI